MEEREGKWFSQPLLARLIRLGAPLALVKPEKAASEASKREILRVYLSSISRGRSRRPPAAISP